MRRFKLERLKDITGISGTGFVAEGVVFGDGRVAMRWVVGQYPTTVVHDSIASVEALHVAGHGAGNNRLLWIDDFNECETHHRPSVMGSLSRSLCDKCLQKEEG